MRARPVFPILIAGTLLLVACSGGAQTGTNGADVDTATVTLGIPSNVSGRELDPHQSAGGHAISVLYSMYETLYDLDENGTPQPNIVETEMLSDDGLTLTMTLREGLTFHDGSTLDAEDVVFSLDRGRGAHESLESSSVMTSLSTIASVEALDSRTVAMHFTEPDPVIRNSLSYFGGMILPSDYLLEIGNDAFVEAPVGSGPYQFAGSVPGQSVELTAFEGYAFDQKPSYQTVTLRILEEGATRIAQLRSGDIDFAYDVDISQIESLEAAGSTVVSNPSGQKLHVFINSRSDVFDDPRVAQAMNFAVDKEAIVHTIYRDHASVSSTMVPTVTAEEVAPYEYDQEKARELLAESDYDGRTLVMNYPAGRYAQDQQVVQAVQAALGEIGMTIELSPMDSTQWLQGLRDKSLDDLTLTMQGNEAFDPYQVMYTGSTCEGTWALYCNPEHDEKLAAIKGLSGADRHQAFVELSEGFKETTPALFLVGLHQVYGMNSDISWTPHLNIRNFDFTDIRPKS